MLRFKNTEKPRREVWLLIHRGCLAPQELVKDDKGVLKDAYHISCNEKGVEPNTSAL